MGGYATDLLNKTVNSQYRHQTNKGAVIYSKHPIINKGYVDFGTITNSCAWADIVIDLDTFRVYSVHLKSNSISKDAEKVLETPDLQSDDTWTGIRGIFYKYVKTHIVRSKQSKMVKKHIDNSPYPVILCGDFNDTPISYTYHHLKEGLIDNFMIAGNGIGTTFNGKIPLLRIDYIMTDPTFSVNNFNIIKEDYSDHYPVASIVVPRNFTLE